MLGEREFLVGCFDMFVKFFWESPSHTVVLTKIVPRLLPFMIVVSNSFCCEIRAIRTVRTCIYSLPLKQQSSRPSSQQIQLRSLIHNIHKRH